MIGDDVCVYIYTYTNQLTANILQFAGSHVSKIRKKKLGKPVQRETRKTTLFCLMGGKMDSSNVIGNHRSVHGTVLFQLKIVTLNETEEMVALGIGVL